MSTKLFNRFFHRGSQGVSNKSKNFRVERTLNVNGTSYKVCIPPVAVEDLGLHHGVILERKGDILIIRGRGNNAKK
jgi:hypothetical protein